jgi:hypothetical protein
MVIVNPQRRRIQTGGERKVETCTNADGVTRKKQRPFTAEVNGRKPVRRWA